MPGIGGVEATRQLRALGHAVPIVALTADSLSDHTKRSLEAGCDAHLTKPIKKQNLLDAVEKYHRKRGPAPP